MRKLFTKLATTALISCSFIVLIIARTSYNSKSAHFLGEKPCAVAVMYDKIGITFGFGKFILYKIGSGYRY